MILIACIVGCQLESACPRCLNLDNPSVIQHYMDLSRVTEAIIFARGINDSPHVQMFDHNQNGPLEVKYRGGNLSY